MPTAKSEVTPDAFFFFFSFCQDETILRVACWLNLALCGVSRNEGINRCELLHVLCFVFYVMYSDPVSLWVAHGRHAVTRQRFEVGIQSRRENLTDGCQRLRWSEGGLGRWGLLPWSGCHLRNGLVPTSKIRPSPGCAEASH